MKIFTKLLCAAALLVAGQQVSAQTLLDNFENTRLLSYPVTQGVLTEGVDNPFKAAPNTSDKVGKYVRAVDKPYSTQLLKPKNGLFEDVSAYKSGAKKLTMKFLSALPAGTRINLVMQNSARIPLEYPNGNYAGLFFAVTTAQPNTWETLTFAFEAPDGSFDTKVTATQVDQIAMLIAPGDVGATKPAAGATFYFDDFMGPAVVPFPTSGLAAVLLDNFETTRLVAYQDNTQGTLTEGADNPFKTAPNTSAKVAKYVRKATEQYATLSIKTKSGKFSDVAAYTTNGQQLTMKFLSLGPGTKVQLVFQDAAKVHYPLGNYAGDFFATTTAAANTWETLTFAFTPGTPNSTPTTGSFDTTVKSTDIDQIAMLIAPGEVGATNVAAGATYYFDDLMGPAPLVTGTATRTAQTAFAAFAPIYPNPASGSTKLPYSLQKAAVVSLAVFDNMGRRVTQVLDQQRQAAGQFSADLNTARLAPGLYTCRLLVDGVALTRQLSVQ